ncbi:hypothetical protein [Bradyrhizobium sp. S69]|uniref:hypothetical protein n=1 Tax=Bradyrhizobium sp. S69 TaxID=1641856 RepID=UPI001AEE0DF9|nr:hypothetical protein [Bradyrhizobium sp. S69]
MLDDPAPPEGANPDQQTKDIYSEPAQEGDVGHGMGFRAGLKKSVVALRDRVARPLHSVKLLAVR